MARKAEPRKAPRASRGTRSKAPRPLPKDAAAPPAPTAPAAVKTTVKITAAKGRPMLTWVGKRALSHLPAFPAQLVERFEAAPVPDASAWKDWPAKYPKGGLLFHGDNKEVLAHLLANGFRGKVQLIYIDPPFDSGADYVRRVTLRGTSGTTKIDGETYTLGEQIQYTDIWANDNYLQFMYERLLLLKEFLSETGAIWIHCDPERGHYLKILADEVFGNDRFVNQIVWKRSDAHSDVGQGARHLGSVHDMVLLYSNGPNPTWNDVFSPLPQSTVDSWYRNVEAETGRMYNKADVTAPGGSAKGNPVYEWKGIVKAWRYSRKKMEDLESKGLLVYSSSGMPYRKRYLDESRGVPLQDWWDDIQMVRGIQRRGETFYPTEKPEELLERVLTVSSNPRDIILDCFIGSGTTAAVAQKLGRRWIGCDINKGAIQTTAKRLQKVIEEQAVLAKAPVAKQGSLIDKDDAAPADPAAAQLGFTTWRVNDYDLQIQHNEAVNLACEHLGVQRTRGDRYFDGTLGRSLVKIVSFDHPLSPVDIEDLKRELDSRRDEDRDVTFVCLGIELAAQASVDDWNRLRKGQHAPNRLHVIELRRDAKHGGWLNHTPAEADVSITRKGASIVVTIKDFISPSIVERLRQQAGVLEPKIEDCRAMIDSVAIDTDYNGMVLNVVIVDVPEKKTDFVDGRYEFPAPGGETTVAVRITDMLGEDVLVTKVV